MVRLDLTNFQETAAFISQTKPQIVIHAAAQRFPDKVDQDFQAAQKLNIESTRVITEELSEWI